MSDLGGQTTVADMTGRLPFHNEVRSGRACVWGIDPAMARVAFAFADVVTEEITTETLDTHTTLREGERLSLIDARIREYARARQGEFPPEVVWIEQPSGKFIKPALSYAVGVIQVALYQTLEVPVWTITSGDWKKRTVGKGNATKEQIAAWVKRHGADFNGQDEADAWGIAHAGRQLFRTAVVSEAA